jgi:hypothetical protein
MTETIKKLQTMLQEAQARRSWGTIEVDLKDGVPYLLRQTIQTKIEETHPNVPTRSR